MTAAQREIILAVAARHRLTLADVVGPRRFRKIAHARQEAMYELRQAGRWSFPQIARAVGRKDHSVVIHGCRAHEARKRAAEAADVAAWDAIGRAA